MSHTENDVLATAEAWRKAGREVAVATVVETWGSAPRPVGSHLVVDGDGNFEGSVSGGCVEGAVVTEAIDVIGDGAAKTLEFGVADETAWRVGPVLRRAHPRLRRKAHLMDLALLQRLNAHRARARSGDRHHRHDQRGGAAGRREGRLCRRPAGRRAGAALSLGRIGHRAHARRQGDVPHRASAAAAPHRHRGGPHQPGAGADGQDRRLRHDHRRSAHRPLRRRNAFPMSPWSRNGRRWRSPGSASTPSRPLPRSPTIPRSTTTPLPRR